MVPSIGLAYYVAEICTFMCIHCGKISEKVPPMSWFVAGGCCNVWTQCSFRCSQRSELMWRIIISEDFSFYLHFKWFNSCEWDYLEDRSLSSSVARENAGWHRLETRIRIVVVSFHSVCMEVRIRVSCWKRNHLNNAASFGRRDGGNWLSELVVLEVLLFWVQVKSI